MELLISPTQSTPDVQINLELQTQVFKGVSIPTDAISFYEDILEFVKNNADNFHSNTTFLFEFQYFNTASSKAIFQLLTFLNKSIKDGKQWKIKWIYEEENDFMFESGLDFEDMLDTSLLAKAE